MTTLGTADSFLKASHILRTRHAHEVTAAALCVVMYKAYNAYKEPGVDEVEEPKSFSDWRKQAKLECSQFHNWSLTLHFQSTTLIFVRSFREENFQLSYKNASQFPLDNTTTRDGCEFILAISNVLKQKFQQWLQSSRAVILLK